MSLARRSIQSSIYNIGSHGFQVVILFIRSVMLARLLSPEIFGVYAFAQAIVAITRILPTFGLGNAYIHHSPESDHEDAPGVYLTLISGFTLVWAILLISSTALFVEYKNYWVLWILVAVAFVSHLVAPAQSILAKQVSFQRPAILSSMSAAITTLIALFLARNGAGIWSLLSVDIINVIIFLVGFYIIKPVWRPRLIWSQPIVHYFLRFGGQVMQAKILMQLIDRLDDLWVGYFLGNTPLGYYSRAYTFANYPRRVLASPINGVAFSTYSEAKSNPDHLSKAFFRVNALIIRTSFLFAGILFLISPELVLLLLGEKWLPMLGAFHMMIFYTMLDPIKHTVGHLFVAIGQPNTLVRVRAIQLAVLLIGLFPLGFYFGIVGVALASTIMVTIGTVFLLWQARKYVIFSSTRLFGIPLIALIISGFTAYSSIFILNLSDGYWKTSIIKFVIFTLIYAGIVLLAEWHQVFEMFQLVQHLFLDRKGHRHHSK